VVAEVELEVAENTATGSSSSSSSPTSSSSPMSSSSSAARMLLMSAALLLLPLPRLDESGVFARDFVVEDLFEPDCFLDLVLVLDLVRRDALLLPALYSAMTGKSPSSIKFLSVCSVVRGEK